MSKTPSIRDLLTYYKDILEKSPQKKNSSYEFEVRFREEKINKQTYDEIFKTLSKYGFKISNTEYQLKIVPNENSDIRVELNQGQFFDVDDNLINRINNMNMIINRNMNRIINMIINRINVK